MTRRALVAFALLVVVAFVATGCGRVKERREAKQTQTAAESIVAPATSANDTGEVTEATSQSPAPVQETLDTRATTTTQTTACPAGATTGLSVKMMTSSGIERSYRLYVPSSYDASAPVAMVLNFHGLGGSGQQQERGSGFIDIAEREGFVLVSPDGTNSPKRWYIYGKWERGYVDDFAFVDDLIDEVSASVCIDPARIFATGMSNGAGLSSLLGCENDRIAAIAPVAGSPYSAYLCRNAGPVPVIAFHGTDDTLVPFDGGNGGRLGLPVTPVRDNMRDWAEHNGCDMTLQTERIAEDVVLERYTNCDEGADVLLYVIEGGGHTWPGATRDIRFLG